MKRISLLSIFAVLIMLILLSQGCKNKVTPGCLYDLTPATPTPSVPLWISANVKDINTYGVPVAMNGLTLTAKSGDTLQKAITGADGTAALEVFGYGDHIITITKDVINGYPSDLTYTVHVKDTLTYYNIVRNQPSFTFGLEPGYSTTYAYLTTTVKYDIVYHTNTKKHCDLSISGLTYPQISATFDPSFVENDGDKSVLTLVTPKYFTSGGYASKVPFEVQGKYSNTLPTSFGKDALIQNWEFRPTFGGSYSNIGNHNSQLNFSIYLPGASINAPIANLKIHFPENLEEYAFSYFGVTSPYWTVDSKGTIWEDFQFGNAGQTNHFYDYTYTSFDDNPNGHVIYHFEAGDESSVTNIKLFFQFYTDDGFSQSGEIDANR